MYVISLHPTCMHNSRTVWQGDRRGNWHTVETGHNVGLTAITSKVIRTPDGKKQSHRKRGRRRVVDEWKGERKQKEREGKGGVKRRVFVRKSEKGGRGEGERQRDIELDQQHNYKQQKQSVPMDGTTVCMVECTAHCVLTWEGERGKKKGRKLGEWGGGGGQLESTEVIQWQLCLCSQLLISSEHTWIGHGQPLRLSL